MVLRFLLSEYRPDKYDRRMGSSVVASEIIESENNMSQYFKGSRRLSVKVKEEKDSLHRRNPTDIDLSQLIKEIDQRISSTGLRPSHKMTTDIWQKNTSKKPANAMSLASEIGMSESVTLKQALRRVCILQASEMAAGRRLSRDSKIISTPNLSEARPIKRMYASVVPTNEIEETDVPEKINLGSSGKMSEADKNHKLKSSKQKARSSTHGAQLTTPKALKSTIQDVMASTETADVPSAPGDGNAISKTHSIQTSSKPMKLTNRLLQIKPALKSKINVQKKGKQEPNSSKCSDTSSTCAKSKQKKSVSSAVSNMIPPDVVSKEVNKDGDASTPDVCSKSCKVGGTKTFRNSGSGEKGESSQSSKSSIGDYSTSTNISDDSHRSGSSGNGSRPHMSKDVKWVAIHRATMNNGSLGLNNFRLLKRLGCGDIGTVYLAELNGSDCLFAIKVMDVEFLINRKKMLRAQTEREILQMLDHPFLPTLYSHFITDNLSCLVMEYCPGGDLHILRQRQPGRSFSEPAARFYVAEVLLSLEYLHMLGVVYRDLKPENILVREDGHIMLSDFDLSLRCTAHPILLKSSSLGSQERLKKLSGPCSENHCIEPLCLKPTWGQASCFTPRLISSTTLKDRKLKFEQVGQAKPLPQLVVEPTEARSNSFVGTHEYLAPEIIRGDGHGSAVDWWTLGIFLYELLFGKTPFKGPGNDETLGNAVSQSLKFPESPGVSANAKDLIKALLVKEPDNRLGSTRGAAEIKQHPFFAGLNWALIRCAAPPEVPRSYDIVTPTVGHKKKESKCFEFGTTGDVEFEVF